MVQVKKESNFDPQKVNAAFDLTCEELQSQFARYPIKYDKWLGFGAKVNGKPTFLAATMDEGVKMDYVYCQNGPKGRGYYHLRTKTSYVNLYTRLSSSPPGGACGCFGGNGDELEAWDLTKRVVYERSQYTKPDDKPGPIEVDMRTTAASLVASIIIPV